MKIGVCVGTDVDRMKIIKDIGYDYIESNCQDIAKCTDEKLEEIKAVGLPVVTANCFIGLKVVGEERDDEKIKEYLARLFKNASYLGMKYLVFGSSGARKKPDNMTLEECKAQTVDFLKRLVLPNCEKYGIRIAIEPLRPAECNWLNTVENGYEIAQAVGSPYINVLADVKHMYEQNEPFSTITAHADKLIHAHTSNPVGNEKNNRIYPAEGDSFNQDDFMLPLIEAGVETCSIEAGYDDFAAEAKAAFEVLKKYR